MSNSPDEGELDSQRSEGQDRRTRIQRALDHRVDVPRLVDGVTQELVAGSVTLFSLVLSVTLCVWICPREYLKVGLVFAILVIPSLTALLSLGVLQMLWWRRYRSLHPAIYKRGCSNLFFFLGLLVIAFILLFDFLRK